MQRTEVNGRAYRLPELPSVVGCVDGCAPDYIAQAVAGGHMPWMQGVLEAAARCFEERVNDAVAHGARLLYGNRRAGALYSPTVVDRVTPEMTLVRVSELNVGSVNIREVPGYRLELTPFGGIKDSGLGYKEGVQEAMKSFSNLKTYSLPW
jgi:acyl-CoA reductase-like NAD-dependent aldehyde dehydrogenase